MRGIWKRRPGGVARSKRMRSTLTVLFVWLYSVEKALWQCCLFSFVMCFDRRRESTLAVLFAYFVTCFDTNFTKSLVKASSVCLDRLRKVGKALCECRLFWSERLEKHSADSLWVCLVLFRPLWTGGNESWKVFRFDFVQWKVWKTACWSCRSGADNFNNSILKKIL